MTMVSFLRPDSLSGHLEILAPGDCRRTGDRRQLLTINGTLPYNTSHSELAQLGGYMTAKFLWNPDYDEQTAMSEFLGAYYGRGAGPIRAYLDKLHDRVTEKNIHVNIWAPPDSPHLTDELLIEANRLWQQAESLTANDPEVCRRVKLSRMSVDYAILERARLQAAKAPAADSPLRALATVRFEPFFEVLAPSGLTRIREWTLLDVDDYRGKLAETLGL